MFVNTAAGSVMENNGSWIHQQHHQHQQQQLQNMPFDPTQPQPAAYAYFNDQTNPAEYPYGSAAPSFDPSIWYPNSQTTFFYDQPCDVIQNQFDYHHQQQNKQQQPIDDDPRCTRRRISANKKERRRTQSINNAFSQLRNCIPNVPRDTKLSKIKTLRLATKYIEYLMNRLQNPEPIDENTINAADAIDIACDFKADLGKSKKINSLTNKTTISLLKRPHDYDQRQTSSWSSTSPPPPHKKAKCRTGWPQEVWANELRPLKLERIDV